MTTTEVVKLRGRRYLALYLSALSIPRIRPRTSAQSISSSAEKSCSSGGSSEEGR